MSMLYTEEQQLLADTAASFLAEHSPVSEQRKLRDSGVAVGFDETLWKTIAELGWPAIPIREEHGGLNFGAKGLGAVFAEIGRNLSATPMLSSVVLAGGLIQYLGDDACKGRWLPSIMDGTKRLAPALDEGAGHDPLATSMTAQANSDGTGYVLSGQKRYVSDSIGADGWLILARTAGKTGDMDGLSLFLVERGAAGVTEQPLSLIDSRNHAHLALDNLVLPSSALIGPAGLIGPVLDQVLDLGRVCLAAELLGMSEKLFALTLEYLKTRVQFDQPIGSFQALQHRASRIHVGLELARTAVMAGLAAQDDGKDPVQRARMASLAKWKAGEVAQLAGNEAVQMHGGIGVTDELDVGFYLKRIRVAQAALGDSDFHVERFARLNQRG